MISTPAAHPRLMDRLSPDEQEKLYSCATVRRLRRHAQLFRQSEPLHELFIVLRGRIRVYYTSAQGHQLTFAYWSEGTLVGTPGVRHTFEHMWNAEAAVDTELLSLSGGRFSGLLAEIPALSFAVIEALEFKARRLANLAQILATSSVPDRLKMLLVNLAELYGTAHAEQIVIAVPFTHEELSGMVGASRPWVTTMLTRMRGKGLVESQGRLMAIPDLGRLKAADFNEFRP